jgi:uncharacterized delta-60 repeat protein
VAAATAVAIGVAGTAWGGATSGDLDINFGVATYTRGEVVTHPRNDLGTDVANGLVLLPGGKLVAAGESEPNNSNNSDFALAGFEPYGGADTDFGKSGFRLTNFKGGDDGATAIARAPGNKLVVAGFAETSPTSSRYAFAVARYTNKGKLDKTFSHDGRVTTRLKPGDDDDQAFGVVVNPRGKITVAGRREPGSGGGQFALVRYRAGGKLDKTFSNDGKALTNFPGFDTSNATSIAKSGNKVVVGGSALTPGGDSDLALARYTRSGRLDSSFSGDGRVTDSFLLGADNTWRAVLVQPGDRKIVAGGSSVDGGDSLLTISRYLPNGEHDPGWNGGSIDGYSFAAGGIEEQIRALAIRGDGRVYAAGDSNDGSATQEDFMVARFETDGDLDQTFGGGAHPGVALADFDTNFDRANALVIQGNQPVLAGQANSFNGEFTRFALARWVG